MRPLETGRSGRRMHSPLVPQDDTTHVEAVEGGGRYEEVSGVVKVRDGDARRRRRRPVRLARVSDFSRASAADPRRWRRRDAPAGHAKGPGTHRQDSPMMISGVVLDGAT
jgi:hypothetical protein